jgi:hypothetical protein
VNGRTEKERIKGMMEKIGTIGTKDGEEKGKNMDRS